MSEPFLTPVRLGSLLNNAPPGTVRLEVAQAGRVWHILCVPSMKRLLTTESEQLAEDLFAALAPLLADRRREMTHSAGTCPRCSGALDPRVNWPSEEGPKRWCPACQLFVTPAGARISPQEAEERKNYRRRLKP